MRRCVCVWQMKDYRRDLRVDDQAEADFAELQTKASIETLSIKPNAELFEKILDGRRGNREFTDSVWKEICSDFKVPQIFNAIVALFNAIKVRRPDGCGEWGSTATTLTTEVHAVLMGGFPRAVGTKSKKASKGPVVEDLSEREKTLYEAHMEVYRDSQTPARCIAAAILLAATRKDAADDRAIDPMTKKEFDEQLLKAWMLARCTTAVSMRTAQIRIWAPHDRPSFRTLTPPRTRTRDKSQI